MVRPFEFSCGDAFAKKREGGGEDPPPFSDRKTTYSRPTNVDQSRGGRDERERKGRNRRAEEEEEGDEKHEISRILARGENSSGGHRNHQ